MFFQWLLILHNIFRWLVLAALAWALLRAYLGWLGKREWKKADRQAGMFLTMGYDIQFLLGLILTFISPIIATALANLSAAMRVNELRFFAVEHIPVMFIALVVGHITSARSRKAQADDRKHRAAAIGFTIVAILTLVAIPWFRPMIRI
jgi:hypothetical protein